MTAAIAVARGSLHLPQEVYELYFRGLDAVALQRRGDDLVILPIRHLPAGGFILKHRNARGDRVVSAGDFFRSQGLDDERERCASVQWDEEMAAVRAAGVFQTKVDRYGESGPL